MLLHPFMKGGIMVYGCMCLCDVCARDSNRERRDREIDRKGAMTQKNLMSLFPY